MRTLIESWDGTRWSSVPSPNRNGNNFLNGMSCASAAACTATGTYGRSNGHYLPLIEAWNGTRWTIRASPAPGTAAGNDALYGVSCTSATTCTATGDYYKTSFGYQTLIESETASG